MNRAVCTLLLLTIWGTNAYADGLIWRLPPDGTFVEFRGECQGECQPVLSKEFTQKLPANELEKLEHVKSFKMERTVTVSSVGEVKRAEQNCRWIELKMQSGQHENVLKILVPEKFLTRGEDPLDHAILTFFNPKDVDRTNAPPEKGFDRLGYEIDRFRPVFPTPLKHVRELPRKAIETPIGTFSDCEVIAGTTEFDRPLLAQGRWEVDSSWQIALHPDAPFGVVQIHCEATAREVAGNTRTDIRTTCTLTISGKGNDAKSRLARGSDSDGGKSETASIKEKRVSSGPKEETVENRKRSTALPGSALTAVLLQEAVQRDLNLSQDQIARLKKIDEGLRQPTSLEDAQDPGRDENARQQLEKDLSQDQVNRLFRVVVQRFGPLYALNNRWISDRLKLTSEQRNRSAEILGNMKDDLRLVVQEMQKVNRSGTREEFTKLTRQIGTIREKANKDSLGLLTAAQKAEYEKLKGEPPKLPIADRQ